MSVPFGAHDHAARMRQSLRNHDDDGEHVDDMTGIQTDHDDETADDMTEYASDDDGEHDDEMTEVGSNNEEEDYPSHDTRDTNSTLEAHGYGAFSTSTGNSEHALLHHSTTPRSAQYTGLALSQNNATGITAPQHQGASSFNHATNTHSHMLFGSASWPSVLIGTGPTSAAVYQSASSYLGPNTSAPRPYAHLAQPSGFGVDGVVEHQSATYSAPTETPDEDMENEQDGGEYDEQSEEEDGEKHESENDDEDEDEDLDDESDGMSDFSTLSIAKPPQPIRSVVSLTDLDTVLQAATEKLQNFIRIPHNILRNRTEPSLYDLADELWSEADDPYQEEGSAQYFEAEGDAAERAGVKVGMWVDEAAKNYVSATQLADRLTREQQSTQALRLTMESDGDINRAQLVAVFREINITNTSLQVCLRKLDDARNSMRRLTRMMHGHKEFRHVAPRTPDLQIYISVVTAEVETYEPFKLERFLLRCQRLVEEDVGQNERCLFCCEGISPRSHKEKTKFEMGCNEAAEEFEEKEEPKEVVRVGLLVADVACLRSWLQTNSKCPLTKKKLY